MSLGPGVFYEPHGLLPRISGMSSGSGSAIIARN